MELIVDESFAKKFNDRKTNEYSAKNKKNLKRQIKELEESSSSSESDNDIVDTDAFIKQADAFLNKLNNCNDTKDKLPVWVPDYKEPESKKMKYKPIYGKDINTKIILERGDDDEKYLSKLDHIANIENTVVLKPFDISRFCNFDGDLIAPAKIERKIEFTEIKDEDLIHENLTGTENLGSSDDEDCEDEAVMVLDMGRHEGILGKKSTKRSTKRKEAKEQKKVEMKNKLKKLRAIELKEMEDVYEKIRIDHPEIINYLKPEDLDDNFDVDKLNEIMERMYQHDEEHAAVDEDKPVFSDLEFDYESDEEDVKKKKKTVSKQVTKSSRFINVNAEEDNGANHSVKATEQSSFKKLMKHHTPVVCDDIIKDVDGADIVCKFKYRDVEPQNFGLTIDEIILSENKELNRWASLKKVVCIRTQEQERRDEKMYSSERKLQTKKDILVSMYEEEEREREESEEDVEDREGATSKHAKKRLRKALKKQKMKADIGESHPTDDTISSKKEKKKEEKEKKKKEKEENEEKKKKKKEDKAKEVITEAVEGPVEGGEMKDDVEEDTRRDSGQKSASKKKRKHKKVATAMPNLGSNRLLSYGVDKGFYNHLKSEKRKEKE